MGKLIAAIDQGTTSTRCMIFNLRGEIVGASQREHRQIFPKAGWVEHDPLEIWEQTQRVVAEAVAKLGRAGRDDLAAVGITNQRETTVVWNRRTGRPYHNALVWQDTRTDRLCAELAGEAGPDRFRARVGLPLSIYFAGPKLRWLLDHVPGLRADAERGEALFGTVDSWLVWNLTGGVDGGVHITDRTNASRTMLMGLESGQWDETMLESMGVPRAMLPAIRPSSDPNLYGHTLPEGPFGARIPICGVLGDQQAATVGQCCFAAGEAKNTYGTGCFMLLNTGTEIVHSRHGLLTTVCYQFGDAPIVYALEGSIAVTGSLVQWLRDNLHLIDSAAEIENLAYTVEDNGGVYFVPAFSGLYAPYWRSDARGVIVGLTRFANRGHLARAALEATAFQTPEASDAMYQDSGVALQALKVDGGMVRNELLMQFQADVLGVPVVRPRVSETTALGAAYAAGLAVGFWRSTDELRANWGVDKSWVPTPSAPAHSTLYARWKKAVTRTFDWVEEP